MAYKVLSDFREGDHLYRAGDHYPVEGVEVTDDRINYLASSAINKAIPFIEKLSEDEKVADESPFKGVKAALIRKKLEEAEIEIPEDIDREGLIQLMLDNDLSM